MKTIITYIITCLLGMFLSFIVNKIVKTIKGEKTERRALMILLQNNLTNLAYVCIELGYIMDYQLKLWCNMLAIYESLDGNDFVHSLDEIVKKLPVKTTNVLLKR